MIYRAIALSSLVAGALASKGEVQQTPRQLKEDVDYSWIGKYNIKYENCFHTQNVVSFRLCPSDKVCRERCSNGGEYLADLGYFIDAFTEAQLNAREYQCEMARENCSSDDESACYTAAGLENCNNDQGNVNGFNLQDYLGCTALANGYYVGPYCGKDNYSIFLGVFSDAYCTTHAHASIFFNYHGYNLPYSESSIIANECVTCNEHVYDDEGDQDDILEQCEDIYKYTYTKCETHFNATISHNTAGCTEIETIKKVEGVATTNGRKLIGHFLWITSLFVLGAALYQLLRDGRRKRELEALGMSDGVCYFLCQSRRQGSEDAKGDTEYYMADDTDSSEDSSKRRPMD